jgi:glycosyltransferase involved in cell wall biosynthesis
MPFAPFRRLRERLPSLHLVLAGPRLDPEYAALVDAELARTPGSTYAGELPHDAIYGAMAASDLILNCSHSEGGMANTVLEAMTTDTPVLVSRIPGNLSLVREGVTGLTFETDQEFEQQVEHFLANPREVRRLAQTARDEVTRTFRREAEAQSYELVYREAAAL